MNHHLSFLSVVLLLCFLSGCATTKTPTPVFSMDDSTPKVGVTNTVPPGESLVLQRTAKVGRGLVLSQESSICNSPNRVLKKDVIYREYVSSNGDKFYCGLAGRLGSTNEFETCVYESDGGWIVEPRWIGCQPEELPGSVQDYVVTDADNLQRNILYSGRSGNIIHLEYREYFKDFARPAHNQSFSFDISDDPVVAVKGAMIEVIEASNRGITYVLLKEFKDF